MFVPFHSLPPASRLWIYQCTRKFSADEKTIIENALKLFTEQWAAHGHPLTASFKIAFDQFLIIGVDESHESPSGCSIDASVHAVKELSQRLSIDFFDRSQVAFIKGDGEVVTIRQASLKDALSKGDWNADTRTFNNLISAKSQLDSEWVIRSADSWLKRYLSGEKVVS